jgi:2',3'-cyclic-nucleotide 2'-phosphodiesterase (5'-nucleotidase family)
VIKPSDYFTQNWRIVPPTAVARAYRASHPAGSSGERAPFRAATGPHMRIISTNDFHGALEARPDSSGKLRGGAAYVATAIKRAAAECRAPDCVSLLLDGGDEWQGTPASNLAYGRPGVRIFERMGVAASALGNHEFDWTQDTLRARMREANYRILGANVRDSLGRDVRWIRNDTIVRRGRYRVGIIGIATTETPSTTRARNVAGLRFVDPAPVVDSIARSLRARGANMVVVIAHAGAFCDRTGEAACKGEIVDLANKLTSPVDAIVSGHTHSYVDAVVNGMPIVQARSRGQAIAVADIYPSRLGAADSATAHVREIYSDTIPPDPAIDSIVRRAVASVGARMSAPVAQIAENYNRRGSQSRLGNLIADSQRWSAKADVAVMNNGGIRADLRGGPVTYGGLYEIQPFGNTLFRYTITGRALRAYMEGLVDGEAPNAHVSGVVVRYDHTRPKGQRLVSLTRADGTPIADDDRYTVAMNDFLVTGGDGLALQGNAIRLDDLKTIDVDAFAAYLKTLPQPVVAPSETRIIDVAER